LKFEQRSLLEKQIEKGGIQSYLIVHPNKEERKKLLSQVGEKIACQTEASIVSYEGKQWDSIYHNLSAPSLFGDQEVILWDLGKGGEEEVLPKIQRYIMNPSSWASLLIGVESLKPFAALYKEAQKQIALLDLSEEKPWEKEKRQQQDLVALVRKEGKDIAQNALSCLLSLSSDSFTLESELTKVLSYVGDRMLITEQDVLCICSLAAAKGWQIAEEILWEKHVAFSDESLDTPGLLALIGQVRFLTQQARQVMWGIQQGKTPEELSKKTAMRGTALQKVLSRIKIYPSTYLDRAMNLLYEVELLAKNSGLETQFLFRYMCIQFAKEKNERC
jgi:DNA polymerase-3 subunit delta